MESTRIVTWSNIILMFLSAAMGVKSQFPKEKNQSVLMNVTQWYAVVLGGHMAWWTIYRLLWLVIRAVRDFGACFVFKHLIYPTLISRVSTCTTTRYQALLITSYIAGNVISITFRASDIGEYGVRAGLLSIINLAPLGICGRTNPIANGWRLSHQTQVYIHSWIGRVAIAEALFHSGISLGQSRLTFKNTLKISGCVVTSPSPCFI